MKVSICCITYNHQKYIEKAIVSFLEQQCSFELEIIISDDCSTDKTKSIVLEYSKKYSNIHFSAHAKNIGMMNNFVFALKQCSGEFIALCEGDDYWTDPYKLQKQVDFLDRNTEAVLIHGPVRIVKENIETDIVKGLRHSNESNILTLAKGNYIHTPTVLFRNVLSEFPGNFVKTPLGDYYLFMLLARYGKLAYSNEVMSVYRIHATSIWSSKTTEYRISNSLKAAKILLSGVEFSEEVIAVLKLQIRKYRKILWSNKLWFKLLYPIYTKLIRVIR
jgi:glycosyltransferase involved in cell wall biosynthesis